MRLRDPCVKVGEGFRGFLGLCEVFFYFAIPRGQVEFYKVPLLHPNMQEATTPRTQKLTRSHGWKETEPCFSVLFACYCLPAIIESDAPSNLDMLSACWQVQAMPRPLIGAGLSANYLQIVVVDESGPNQKRCVRQDTNLISA
jgi:hypothetical protein